MCGAEKFTSKYASRRDLVHEYAAYDEEKEFPMHPSSSCCCCWCWWWTAPATRGFDVYTFQL